MLDITYVTSDGWEGFYVNGRLIIQGRVVESNRLIQRMIQVGILDAHLTTQNADQDWIDEARHLPPSLSGVK
jgi:hypothetical protein